MNESGRALNLVIGRRLRAVRLARGLSLRRLAALTGGSISISRLSRYELGQRRRSIDTARTLATALGDVSAAHLLGADDKAPRADLGEAQLLAAFRATDAEGRRRVLGVAESGSGCGPAGAGSD